MHIHILGICGTFMGGIAAIARQAGHRVTGCDANVYPPMSTQLEAQGIELIEGFSTDQLLQFETMPDLFVIGNVVSRGNPLMEAILNQGLPYISGPQWLGEQVLYGRHVLAVAGTHGKTTTSAMLTWILEFNGYKPGYLIGGVPLNFSVSAHLGESQYFVIEADEYDTAFLFNDRLEHGFCGNLPLKDDTLEFVGRRLLGLEAFHADDFHVRLTVRLDLFDSYLNRQSHVRPELDSLVIERGELDFAVAGDADFEMPAFIGGKIAKPRLLVQRRKLGECRGRR